MLPSQEVQPPAPFVRSTRITIVQLIVGIQSVLLGTALAVYYFLNTDIETSSVPPISSLTGLQNVEEKLAAIFGLAKSGKSDESEKLLEVLKQLNNSLGNFARANTELLVNADDMLPKLDNMTGIGIDPSLFGGLLTEMGTNVTGMNQTMIDLFNAAMDFKNSSQNVTRQALAFDAAYITSPLYCGFIYLFCALISCTCLRKVQSVKHNQKGLVCAVLTIGIFSLISSGIQATFSGWYGWYILNDYLDHTDDPRKKFLAAGLIISSLLGGLQVYLSMFLIGVSCCCPGAGDEMAAEIHDVMAHAVRPIHDRFRKRRPSRRESRRHSRPPSLPDDARRSSRASILRADDARRSSRASILRADDARRSSKAFQEAALFDPYLAEAVPRRSSRSPNEMAEPPPRRQSRASREIEYLADRPRSYSRPRTESRSSGYRV